MGPPPNPTVENLLSGTDITQFRPLAARCNFLAIDRVDIQIACKDICRLAAPTTSDWAILQKMTWYLKVYPGAPAFDHLVDTDYAGTKRIRRSTNGGMFMLGDHLIQNWATTQTVVATSSGEVEYYIMTKDAYEGSE